MRLTHEQILAAGFRFEERGLKRPGPVERETIASANMDHVSRTELANLLRDSIRAAPVEDSLYKCTAYWALGKKQDPRFRDFLVEMLAIELAHSLPCAWQIIIALECIGEEVLTPGTRKSADDGMMILDARRYLQNPVPA